jgi:hypothetical protein
VTEPSQSVELTSLDLAAEIGHEGIDLCFAQMFLLEQGIVVRGGLTIGDVYWEHEKFLDQDWCERTSLRVSLRDILELWLIQT